MISSKCCYLVIASRLAAAASAVGGGHNLDWVPLIRRYRRQKSFCGLSNISLCQNMAQDRFMVMAAHESRLLGSRCKNSWLRRNYPNGAPQA